MRDLSRQSTDVPKEQTSIAVSYAEETGAGLPLLLDLTLDLPGIPELYMPRVLLCFVGERIVQDKEFSVLSGLACGPATKIF